jgi:hypothetical protein
MRMAACLALAALAAPGVEARQAGQGMAGGCEAFKWDMSREMVAWESGGTGMAALAEASPSAAPAPLGRRLDLKLLPAKDVRFAASPERAPETGYAGLLAISVPADGIYRVSAGSRLWIDMVGGGQRVPSARFEGHSSCKLHKSVAFALKAGTYVVQLSGSEKPEVSVLVTAEP